MKVRYSKRAIGQIEIALSFVQANSPSGADNIRRRLVAIAKTLEARPNLGRPTTRAGVRRVSLLPYPYTLDYRIAAGEIVLLRFRHTARRPLP